MRYRLDFSQNIVINAASGTTASGTIPLDAPGSTGERNNHWLISVAGVPTYVQSLPPSGSSYSNQSYFTYPSTGGPGGAVAVSHAGGYPNQMVVVPTKAALLPVGVFAEPMQIPPNTTIAILPDGAGSSLTLTRCYKI